MSIEIARQKFRELTGNLVTDAALSKLHALFPNDFEFYMMAFELEDSYGEVTDRFIFPILPDSINYDQRKITNIQKTAQGVSVLTNNSFVPRTISMDGTFGKWFKALIGNLEEQGASTQGISSGGVYGAGQAFMPNIKTGYGALKQLERLIDKSVGRDKYGKPRSLVFYNLSFNTQYVVKVMSFNPRMSADHNMMWKYNLELQAIAPAGLDANVRAGMTQRLMGMSAINAGIKDTQTTVRIVRNSITPLL